MVDKPKRILIAESHDDCKSCDQKCRITFSNGKASIQCLKLLPLLEAAGRIKGYDGVDPETGEKAQILGLCG